jgi:hypothetical protein
VTAPTRRSRSYASKEEDEGENGAARRQARRGLDADESPTDYGRELDALIDALGLDETP